MKTRMDKRNAQTFQGFVQSKQVKLFLKKGKSKPSLKKMEKNDPSVISRIKACMDLQKRKHCNKLNQFEQVPVTQYSFKPGLSGFINRKKKILSMKQKDSKVNLKQVS